MTKEEIQRVLALSLEYYKSEIFGTDKESEKPSHERIDWIYDKLKGSSEKPIIQDGLDEETIRIEFHTIADKCFNEGIEGWEREKLIARHFAQWGAEHLKK